MGYGSEVSQSDVDRAEQSANQHADRAVDNLRYDLERKIEDAVRHATNNLERELEGLKERLRMLEQRND